MPFARRARANADLSFPVFPERLDQAHSRIQDILDPVTTIPRSLFEGVPPFGGNRRGLAREGSFDPVPAGTGVSMYLRVSVYVFLQDCRVLIWMEESVHSRASEPTPRCIQDDATPAQREVVRAGTPPYGPVCLSDVGEGFMPSRPMHSSRTQLPMAPASPANHENRLTRESVCYVTAKRYAACRHRSMERSAP